MNTPRCKGVDIFLRVNILMPDNLDSSLQVGNTCRCPCSFMWIGKVKLQGKMYPKSWNSWRIRNRLLSRLPRNPRLVDV